MLLFAHVAKAQLTANAGTGKIVCPGITFKLGGTPAASGGTAPYTYSWWPADGLSSTTVANPDCTPTASTYYILTVTDADGSTSEAGVGVDLHYLNMVNAGQPRTICFGDSITIGGADNATGQGVNFKWTPVDSLSLLDSLSPQPNVFPQTTTNFTLTATAGGCDPKVDVVTITVIPTPNIDAGDSVTIKEGEVAILNATGGANYIWSPTDGGLLYSRTANPDAEPKSTTTYYLYGTDPTGQCSAEDSVVVTVTPYDEIKIYNTFTPNNDGNNDTWYIGNIEKYPENTVKIYNRNGNLVYKTTGYENKWDGNTWDGKSFGQNLPAATYYYIIDLKVGDKKYNGTVTIIE